MPSAPPAVRRIRAGRTRRSTALPLPLVSAMGEGADAGVRGELAAEGGKDGSDDGTGTLSMAASISSLCPDRLPGALSARAGGDGLARKVRRALGPSVSAAVLGDAAASIGVVADPTRGEPRGVMVVVAGRADVNEK